MIKRATIFLIACIACMQLLAQVSFKTIVPSDKLVAGESFRIQYVIEGAQATGVIIPPSFKGFRLVSGPELYTSGPDDKVSIRNEIYTLQPLEPGEFFLQGATAIIDGKSRRSNDVLLKVISTQYAAQLRKENLTQPDNTLYLKPGEDPHEKMRQNLFIKVIVDKTVCFTGQPVVATFKLYSRLQSKSDIIKNPGFYGFTVQDMINLDDRVVNTETVNGKEFDVHTVRKVQLYPLQEGIYMVDPMEVKNKVEFSRSVVNKKAEQEIIEGVFDDDGAEPIPGIEVFENTINTEPVRVRVKSLPTRNKPAEFNGATGRYHISSSLEQSAIAKNQQGFISIKIEGAGNFNQLTAPNIQWPAGIEGFDPVVIDEWDKQSVPMKGSRIFRYAFVASNAGKYEIPSVSFPFFDPDSNRYRVLNTKAIHLSVSNESRNQPLTVEKKVSMHEVNKRASYIAAGVVILVLIVMLVFWLISDRRKKTENIAEPVIELKKITVEEALQSAWLLVPAADKDFYTALNQSIWNWLGQHFNSKGTGLNKLSIRESLLLAGNDSQSINKLMEIIHQTEAGMFTNASMDADKLQLMHDTQILLESLQDGVKS